MFSVKVITVTLQHLHAVQCKYNKTAQACSLKVVPAAMLYVVPSSTG